jgi:hypothetical protein
VKYTQASFTIELELKRLNLKIFTSLIVSFDRLSYKAQTNESFTDPQALDYLSQCEVYGHAQIEVSRGDDTEQRRIHDKPKIV